MTCAYEDLFDSPTTSQEGDRIFPQKCWDICVQPSNTNSQWGEIHCRDFFINFRRLVDKVNKSIGQTPESEFSVGVLDIYGFESSKVNKCLRRFPDDQQAVILEGAHWRSQIHL